MNGVQTKDGLLILDGHKLAWHTDRVKAWEDGQRIAPVSIDLALTRACLAAESLISMADGSLKRIDSIRKGDKVLSWVTGRLAISKVQTAWQTSPRRDTIQITSECGIIRVTADHLILTPNGWVEAQDLKAGDVIATAATHGRGKTEEGRRLIALVGGTSRGKRNTTPTAHPVQQNTCLFRRSETEGQRTSYSSKQDTHLFSRRTEASIGTHESPSQEWRYSAWTYDGTGKRGTSPTRDSIQSNARSEYPYENAGIDNRQQRGNDAGHRADAQTQPYVQPNQRNSNAPNSRTTAWRTLGSLISLVPPFRSYRTGLYASSLEPTANKTRSPAYSSSGTLGIQIYRQPRFLGGALQEWTAPQSRLYMEDRQAQNRPALQRNILARTPWRRCNRDWRLREQGLAGICSTEVAMEDTEAIVAAVSTWLVGLGFNPSPQGRPLRSMI